jgi:hypothetical protein
MGTKQTFGRSEKNTLLCGAKVEERGESGYLKGEVMNLSEIFSAVE